MGAKFGFGVVVRAEELRGIPVYRNDIVWSNGRTVVWFRPGRWLQLTAATLDS